MLSKFVIGGVALLAVVSSFVGTNLSFVTTDSSNNVAKELLFSDVDRKNSKFLITYGKLTDSWESYQKTEENNWNSTILYRALEYASKKHKGQIRKDPYQTPYIVHPMGVAKILWEEGNVRDVDVLVAALLHDTLENTDATEFEIETIFGSRVLSIVKEVSNDPTLSRQENKQRQIDLAPFMSQEAKLVKLADRLCNIRDLQLSTPLNWSKEDIEHYFSWGEKLVRAFAGTDEQLENALKWELSHPTSGKSAAISKSLALG